MGLDQFNLSAFWQIIGLKRRLRAIWASGSDCRLPLQRRTGTRRDLHPCVWFCAVRRSSWSRRTFLDPLANDLADSIARMPRRAAIDGGGAVGRVLRHMGGNVESPQIGDEVLCVVTFVGAQGQASGSRRAPDDHLDGRFPLRRSGGGCERRTDDAPIPVLHQSMSHVAELGSLAAAFAIKPGIRVRGRGMRLVTALLVVEMPLAVAAWRGWLV